MPTNSVVLKQNAWTAVTSGSSDTLLQVQGTGNVAFAEASAKPTALTPCIYLEPGRFLQVKAGVQLWARAVDSVVVGITGQ